MTQVKFLIDPAGLSHEIHLHSLQNGNGEHDVSCPLSQEAVLQLRPEGQRGPG